MRKDNVSTNGAHAVRTALKTRISENKARQRLGKCEITGEEGKAREKEVVRHFRVFGG